MLAYLYVYLICIFTHISMLICIDGVMSFCLSLHIDTHINTFSIYVYIYIYIDNVCMYTQVCIIRRIMCVC